MTEHFLDPLHFLDVHPRLLAVPAHSIRTGSDTATGPAAGFAVPACAELAQIVLGVQSLSAVLDRVAELARDLIPEADEVSLTLIEGRHPRTVGFAGDLAATLDERQYSHGRGPCMDTAVSGQSITIADTALDTRYPEFSHQAHRNGIRHTLSLEIPTMHTGSAAMNLCSRSSGPFSAQTRDQATTFAGYASVTLANAAGYACAQQEVTQMKQALTSRAAIEQAKGILMRDHSCSPDDAFALLSELSSRAQHKVRDVAVAIVAGAYNSSTPVT
jgi:GAF domain-containing protein